MLKSPIPFDLGVDLFGKTDEMHYKLAKCKYKDLYNQISLKMKDLGEEIIRERRKISNIPIILKATEIKNLSEKAKKMFEIENKATDLYLLSLKKPQECGLEYKANLIKTEC